MNKEKLTELLKQRSILIPLLCFKNYKNLKLTLEEFVFLMYLKDRGEKFIFDPQSMADDLGMEVIEIMQLVANLSEKKFLTVTAFKNEKNVMEEEVDLKDFYEKYSMLLLEDLTNNMNTVDVNNSSVFEHIEKEFGRTLSPSEFEFIKAWLMNFKEEVILEAVKEAVLNGVSSIRYIDKILYEWDKKGIKNKEDVEHFLYDRKKEIKEPVEVFDYDWFEEDDEEE